MIFRYRVKGQTEKAFILRGMYFRVGKGIDNDIMESELPFVQSHCKIVSVVDLQEPIMPLESMPEKPKKGDRNGRSSRTNKVNNKAEI